MKNVKTGFQLAIGWWLAEMLVAIPKIVRNPRFKKDVKRNIRRICKILEIDYPSKLEEERPIERKTSAFPQCKNAIGFANKE